MTTPTGLKTLQQELQQALSLIDDYSANQGNASSTQVDTGGLGNARSLLERCALVVNADKANSKPTLRILHHFACSGGTLISKCLAAQPNVFLLSELHPTTRLGMNINKAAYTPRDITTQAIYGRVPNVDALAEKLFVNNIIETEKHIRELGGYLVLRAHTHADYCTDKPTPQVDTLTRLLEPHFNIKQLVTIRNPIDSFISLKENGWIHFAPSSFDEYCGRLLKFLKPFHEGKILKYEDFVEKPGSVLRAMAEMLNLDQVSDDLEHIDIFKVSGGSGRSGSDIYKRPRKTPSDELTVEIEKSQNLKTLAKLGFT
ncbi:hypothetical protein [uncultured Gilvimarinus sp.]|jgi:hypothetical protein|uniref:hypothetical protein n=1 Tax=uncultured Gilvimarinus sp. TaxID=1689143 RepID=UPI0030DD285E